MPLLAHQQVHASIGRQRRDRVFAWLVRIARRQHLHQIARLPIADRAAGRRFEFKVKARAAEAAGVQVPTHRQPPRLEHGCRLPVRQVAGAGDARDLVLPPQQIGGVALVDIDALEHRLRAALQQPAVERTAVAAEVLVAAVAQREHAAVKPVERDAAFRILHHASNESGGCIGRIAFAVGADDEQRALGGAQVVGLQLRQAAQPRRHTGGVQRLCCLPGDLLGRAGLAGVHDQHRPRTVGGRRQGGGGALGVEQSLPMQPPGAGAQSEVGQRNAAGRKEAHGVVREAHRQGSNAEWQAARPRFMPAGPRRRPSGEPRDRRHCDE